MKFKFIEPILAFLIVFVMLFNAIGMSIDAFGYSMEDLPEGKFLYSVMSPDSTNTLRLYRVELSRVDTAVRGEVVSLDENGEMQKHNVYWDVGIRTAIAGWKDEKTVTINKQEININGEPYDSRTQIILPEASAKNRVMNNEVN